MKDEQTNPIEDPDLETEILTGAPVPDDTEPAGQAPDTPDQETDEETDSQQGSGSAVEKFARNEEAEQQHSNLSLREILGGDILTGEWLRRQMGLIVLCCVFVIIYITNRYSAEQEIIEIERLKVELQEIKYRALTRSSELTVKSRQSQIEEYLKKTNDSTLNAPKEPPYRITRQAE
ncbi:MAG: FtsL-like putative cell division protein [Clostridium sp.]|nr:FtsL-like putative cell division protein [Clostridium sp.]